MCLLPAAELRLRGCLCAEGAVLPEAELLRSGSVSHLLQAARQGNLPGRRPLREARLR